MQLFCNYEFCRELKHLLKQYCLSENLGGKVLYLLQLCLFFEASTL